jgi:hypothetical protein
MPPSAGLSAAEDTARFLWDEMCVATVPLNLPGAVASPANAVAIV